MHSITQQLVNLTNIYHTLSRLTQSEEALNSHSPALFGVFQQVLYSQTIMQLAELRAYITLKQNKGIGSPLKNTAHKRRDHESVWLSKYIIELAPTTLKAVEEETIVRVYLNFIIEEFIMHKTESMRARVKRLDLQKLHASIEDICDRYDFPVDVQPMRKDSISFLLSTLDQGSMIHSS
ncbi:hypothetical protein [Vibrio sp. FJH11]